MAAAVVLSVLLASGCVTKTGEKSDREVGSNASSSEAQPAEEASDQAPEDSTLTFGETYKYEDGVSIRVGKPKPFKPSEYAAADEAPAYLSFEVVIVNGGAEPFDPSVSTASLQSGDTEASEVFDTENGFDGSPSTKVLPGRQTKYKIGFGVQNPKDLVLEFSPSFEHESQIFTN